MAIQCDEKCSQLNPYDADFYNYIGIGYNQLRKYDEAEKYWKKALEINHSHEFVLGNLAALYKGKKKFQKAI